MCLTVEEFIEKEEIPQEFLQEIREKIRQYFPDCPIVEELFTDPESDHMTQVLIFNIRSSEDVNTAYDTYKSFENDWWLVHMDEYGWKMCIRLEFGN
jgi:uncharacterized protein YnzC (UPF0291/DUF896 family)